MTRTVWLASYPKSGNTWLRMLIANLSADGERPADINGLPERGIASARGLFDRLTLIDSGLLTHDEIDALRPRVYEELAYGTQADDEDLPAAATARFMKVHDAYTRTPKGEPLLAGDRGADGAIVIVRDPRDVAPSLANHSRIGIDEAIAFMNNASAGFCTQTNRQHRQLRQKLHGWSAHVASWLDQTDIPVHLVRYEDMKTDTLGALRGALAFARREADPGALERAVRLSEFSRLQAQEKEKGFREARPGISFFRRGMAGGWRDELTADQVARIENEHAPMMQRLGYRPVSLRKLACAG